MLALNLKRDAASYRKGLWWLLPELLSDRFYSLRQLGTAVWC